MLARRPAQKLLLFVCLRGHLILLSICQACGFILKKSASFNIQFEYLNSNMTTWVNVESQQGNILALNGYNAVCSEPEPLASKIDGDMIFFRSTPFCFCGIHLPLNKLMRSLPKIPYHSTIVVINSYCAIRNF